MLCCPSVWLGSDWFVSEFSCLNPVIVFIDEMYLLSILMVNRVPIGCLVAVSLCRCLKGTLIGLFSCVSLLALTSVR